MLYVCIPFMNGFYEFNWSGIMRSVALFSKAFPLSGGGRRRYEYVQYWEMSDDLNWISW